MPDISKINALAIGSVGKVDGLAKASILDIDGVTVPAGFTGLLDETYASGSTGAYSVRRLANSVTVLMRVRRETAGGAGDDDEADVEYDPNNEVSLDSPISNASAGVLSTTLGQFLNVGTVGGTTYTNADSLTGTAEGRVTEWKDQSGSGKDVLNATNLQQPIIHEGTVNTDLVNDNGKAAMIFFKISDGNNDGNFFYTVISGTSVTVNVSSMYAVAAQESGTLQAPVSTIIATGNPTSPAVRNDFSSFFIGGSAASVTGAGMRIGDDEATAPGTLALVGTTDDANQHLFEWHVDRATSEVIVDGTSEDTSTDPVAFSWTHMGTRGPNQASVRLEGTIQELISFGTDKYANRSSIETNINSDYLIYQPTDAPTSGLLATYTGAAAAYSVRQLSDKAILAMRIRRDSDDEERNIGFDSNGDLDTTAISDFCGTANGYVTRWWDQSTNGNHADQDTDTIQPQIYNGSAVITSGTTTVRPSLQFETSATIVGANTGFNLSFASTLSQPFTASITTRDITTGTDEMCWMDNGNTTGLNGVAIFSDGSPDTLGLSAGSLIGGTAQKDSDMLLFGVFNTTNSELFKNNSSIGSGNAGTRSLDGLTIGGFRPGINNRFGIHGNVQEWILWDTAQGSTNRTGIHSDTNTYFGIY